MPTKDPRFTASQFTPTEFSTADDKAKFANHFVRFVRSDFKETLFPKWFYTRLSMMFGHIAHYNQNGFYDAQFGTTAKKRMFLIQTLDGGGYGSPAFTYSDVEKVLSAWVRETKLADYYAGKLYQENEDAEKAELARLTYKYGKPQA